MASVTRKKGSKYWFACFRDEKGKQHQKSTKQTSHGKALKVAERFEEVSQKRLSVRAVRETVIDLAKQSYGDVIPIATTRRYFSDWLKMKALEVEPGSLELYAKAVNKFLNFLGDRAEMEICTVTRASIVEFRNSVAATVSAATTNGDLGIIKHVFRRARLEGYIVEDPSELVEPVRDDQKVKKRAFTVQELQRMLEVADKEWKSLILFGLYTGQRLGDVVSLTWDNVDLARNEIRLETQKTGKILFIPLAAPLREHIDSLPAGDEPGSPLHPWAFKQREEGKLSNVSNAFADLLVSAGLRQKRVYRRTGQGREGRRKFGELTFHSLRRTATTLLHEAGVPAAVAQALIGHDSEEVHQLYVSVGREAIEKAVAKLPKL